MVQNLERKERQGKNKTYKSLVTWDARFSSNFQLYPFEIHWNDRDLVASIYISYIGSCIIYFGRSTEWKFNYAKW